MRRVLLDQNAPRGLRLLLSDHVVQSAYQLGWAALSNGELLAAAERAGFDVMVTGDQNLTHQQNLTGRKLAIVALTTNHWATLRANPQPIRDAVQAAEPGGYTVVAFPRPPLRSRPPPPR